MLPPKKATARRRRLLGLLSKFRIVPVSPSASCAKLSMPLTMVHTIPNHEPLRKTGAQSNNAFTLGGGERRNKYEYAQGEAYYQKCVPFLGSSFPYAPDANPSSRSSCKSNALEPSPLMLSPGYSRGGDMCTEVISDRIKLTSFRV